MAVLLTIAVPTYNRCSYLERLLSALIEMTQGLEGRVELFVSDNASSDGAEDLLRSLEVRAPHLRWVRNTTNIGVDANISQCFRAATGRFVWIIGDDDMPKPGVVAAMVELLQGRDPDLVYLPSEWLPDVQTPTQGSPVRSTAVVPYDKVAFARHVNVWITFLSGIIVRKSHADGSDLDALVGTNLIQLGWVLPALRHGQCLLVCEDRLVLATSGNTGGYAVIKVFGINLSMIVARTFGRNSAVHRAIIGPAVASYLPQLVWNIRTGAGGRFDAVFPWRELRGEIGRYPSYWGLVVPIGRAPRPIARGALLVSRVVAKLRRRS